jgi:hypothetical protein
MLWQIEFTEALLFLQELIDSEVKATVNVSGQFFGCALCGRLSHVDTLPPDHAAISVVVAGGQGFFLDPVDTEAFVGRGEAGGRWLELRLAFGAAVVIERAEDQGEPAEPVR